MQYRDLIYNVDDRREAKNWQLGGFFYQATVAKNSKWIGSNTHRHESAIICKHSQYSFEHYKKETWDADYANTLLRFGPLYLDVDDGNDPLGALKLAQEITIKLIDLGVPMTAIICCVSGSKGASIYMDSRVMGTRSTNGHQRLPHIHGKVVDKLFPDNSKIDKSVFKGLKKGRLVRTINMQRENGRFRAYVPTDLFISLPVADLEKLADRPGPSLFYDPEIGPVPFLQKLFNEALEEIESTGENKKYKNVIPVKGNKPSNNCIDNIVVGNCSDLFNRIDHQQYDQNKRYNDLSFLAASLLVNATEDSVALFDNFFALAKSETYVTPLDRKTHFLNQLKSVREKNIQKPMCNAIRKTFGGAPCQGCHFLNRTTLHMGRLYSIDETGTSVMVKTKDGGSELNLLTNSQILFRDQRTVYNEEKKVHAILFRFDVFTQNERFVVELTGDELVSNDSLEKAVLKQTRGRCYFSSLEKKPAVQIFQIALADSAYLGESQSFYKVGFFGFNKFVYTNAVVSDGTFKFYDHDIVTFPEGSKANQLRWSKKTLDEVSTGVRKQLKLLREVHQDRIVLPIHAFGFAPVITELVGAKTRFYIIVIGMSGDSKTTVCICAGNYWGNYWGLGKLLSASATANSLEVEASQQGQTLVVIDDVKQANISNPAAFRRIMQNYADGTPRRRLKSDGTPVKTDPILGSVLLSGEDHFAGNETSIQGRGIELVVSEVKKNSDIYQQLEQNSSHVNGSMPYLISFLQRKDINLLKEKFREDIRYYTGQINEGENKERIAYSLAILDFSMFCFNLWAQNELGWSQSECDALNSRTRTTLTEIGHEQAKSASSLVAGNIFLNTLSELISTGKVRIEDSESYDDTSRTNLVGRVFSDQKDKIYFIPGASYSSVKENCEKMGNPFAFSLKALATNLDRLNLLEEKDAGKLTKRRRFRTSNLEYWVISKKHLSISDDRMGSDYPFSQSPIQLTEEDDFQLT